MELMMPQLFEKNDVRGEKRCVSGRDERGLGDWFGGQGVGRGLVEGGGKTKRFAGVKGF